MLWRTGGLPNTSFRGFLSLGMAVILLLVMSAIVNAPRIQSDQSPANNTSIEYSDGGIALINANDTINLRLLNSLTSGNLSVSAFEKIIQEKLLPLGIREVLLDIGWDNYSVGELPYQSWVNSWLAACDKTGVEDLLYLDQLTSQGIGSTWIESIIKSDPSAQTFNVSGQPVNYISPDDPDIATAIETDLTSISRYYGSHPSLVGLSTGVPYSNPYFAANSTIPTLGYSNFTLQQFSNSPYFSGGVNQTGFHADGTADVIWSSFKNATQAIVLDPGNWMSSTRYAVYGTGSSQNIMVMQFYVPQNETNLEISWYGERVGAPGSLQAEIFANESSAIQLSRSVSSASLNSNAVNTTANWQGPLEFSGNFTSGYYWIAFSSPSGSPNDYYYVYMRDYPISNASATIVFPSGQGSISGSAILWEKDGSGNSLEIYPFQQDEIPRGSQTFEATHQFSFNTVFLFLSDRHFNPINATLVITDESTGGVVATGVLSQALMHGLQNWVPIILNDNVTTVAGNEYSISINEPGNGVTWGVVLRGEVTSPSIAGFQNQTQTWLFKLANTEWSQSHIDFTSDGPNGADAVKSSGTEDAVRISLPASNYTLANQSSPFLSSVSVYMSNGKGTGSPYGSGTSLTITLRENGTSSSPPNGMNSEPTGPILQSLTVPGGIIPQNGWLNITGFNVSLTRGQYYWIVFNSSNGFFPMARLVSPYNFYELVSNDGGESWSYPSEGPSDFAIVATFSDGESAGNSVQAIPAMTLGPGDLAAQPFIAYSTEQVNGIDIGPITSSNLPSDFISISINPDNGRGEPSNFPIASGVLYSQNITLDYGPQFVQFTSNVRLNQGQKYWVVLKTMSGSFSVLPVVYSQRPSDIPFNFTILNSGNDGFSWQRPFGNFTAILSYLISTPTVPAPQYNTSQMYQDLINYHSTPENNESGDLGPWAKYVQASQAQTLHNVDIWYLQNTGRDFVTYTGIDSDLIASLDYNDLVGISSTYAVNSCSGLLQYSLSILPIQGEKYHPVIDAAGIPDCPNDPELLNLMDELSLMQFVGGSFGNSSVSQRTLVVGGGSLGENLTNILSAGFNTTFLPTEDISRLLSTKFTGSFSNIVWLSNSTSSTPSGIQNIVEEYVDGGGKLIIVGSIPGWMNNLSGVNSSGSQSSTSGISALLPNGTTFFNLLVAHTAYSNSTLAVEQLSSRTLIASGENISLRFNIYGRGQVVSLEFSNVTQLSDNIILVSNSLAALSYGSQSSPFWYGQSNSQELSQLVYSIQGSTSGPLLLWISNPSPNAVEFSIFLNSSYYGIPRSWIALDPASFFAISGNTTAIGISVLVQPRTWEPIYIVPRSTNLLGDYSNEVIQRQLQYNGQSLINLAPTVNHSIIFVASANSSLNAVSQNNAVNLTRYSSGSSLFNVSQGWFYDKANNVVFIKFFGTGSDSIRLYEGTEYQPLAPVNPFGTIRLLIYLSAILVAAELCLFVTSRLKKKVVHAI